MAAIEDVIAREILDSRGNPTVEVEVILEDDASAVPRSPPVPRPAPSRRSSCATAGPLRRQGRRRRRSQAVESQIAERIVGLDASDQRLVDQEMLDLDGTPNKANLGANAILGASLAVARAAARAPGSRCSATSAARTPPAAGADDEHPQRRLPRRLQRGHPGVHDRADRRPDLPRGAAARRRGLPRAQGGAEEAGPGHRPGRRGRVRAQPGEQPRRARPDRRGDRVPPASRPARTSRSPWTWRPASSSPTEATPSRAARSRRTR